MERPASQRAELHAVSAAVLAVASRLDVREVLQTIVRSAGRLLDARYAALGVPDDAGSFAEFVVDGIDPQWQRAIGPVPRQHGLLAVLLRDPAPVRLADIRTHKSFSGWPGAHPDLRDFLGVPVTFGGEILGALFLANKQAPGGFTAADEDLLVLLAAHAAIALVNARLYECSRELSIVEERHRIARELHDAVAQKLFSLRLTADAVDALVAREVPDLDAARAQLGAVRALAAEAADELRTVVDGLRPADLAGDGLDVALRKQVALLDRVHETRVRFAGEVVPRLAAGREEAVYRIAQEALHNALRHAAPRTVDVSLTANGRGLVLEVADDGRGFDSDAGARDGARPLGLASMRDRARAVGGRLSVRSRPGKGTRIRLEVPL